MHVEAAYDGAEGPMEVAAAGRAHEAHDLADRQPPARRQQPHVPVAAEEGGRLEGGANPHAWAQSTHTEQRLSRGAPCAVHGLWRWEL